MSTPKVPWIWLSVFAVALLGILPYMPLLEYWPWTEDSVKWYNKCHVDNPDWFSWIFAHRHYIGYRPVAAASLTLNSAIGGPFPLMYRLTDLSLFFGTGLAVYGLWSTLTRRINGWGLVAMVLFLCHPVAQDVVPFLARRTYVLAVFFSTLALICLGRHLNSDEPDSRLSPGPPRNRRWLVASCVCLPLAIFSNEFGYVTLGFMVLLCCTATPGISRQTLRSVLPILATGLASLAIRWLVRGHMGGYHVAYITKLQGGDRVLKKGAGFWDVFQASFDYTLFPAGWSGASPWLLGSTLGIALVLSYYGWRALVRPLLNWGQREERLKLCLALWLVGYATLYGLTNTWFWRQGYPMSVPLALLITLVAQDT
ncbi:MAG: hypothetical protein HN348_24630, partial [Proteobacteria bacterium]|nr:hypothetical protein [Pseudomonadota bacterium]